MPAVAHATMEVRLHAITYAALDISLFEFRPLTGDRLVPFTAGAHIDLYLGDGLVRSYSLVNSQDERDRYVVAVKREAEGRGGSRTVHERLRVGQAVTIGLPRNNFPLNEEAAHSVFIAGGIGITPIYSMVQRLQQIGHAWELHYAARSREAAAFLPELRALGTQVHFHFDDEASRETGPGCLDITSLVAGQPPHAHLYCCGPLPMLHAFERAAAGRPPEQVHTEYFKSELPAATEGGFEVVLQRSGQVLMMEPGQSILDAVLALGVDMTYSCTEGVCGSCEVRVIEGIPDHRDLVLSKEEQEKNDRMMICCSGSKTARLVLDL